MLCRRVLQPPWCIRIVEIKNKSTILLWKIIAGVLALVALIESFCLYIGKKNHRDQIRYSKSKATLDNDNEWKNVKYSLEQYNKQKTAKNLQSFSDSILKWFNNAELTPTKTPSSSLIDISKQLNVPEISNEIFALDAVLYSPSNNTNPLNYNAEKLYKALDSYKPQEHFSHKPKTHMGLLYSS